ncbi:MAG TPA: proline dehydrogenase family protein [Solirubrobacteraceae bacterium]|nr:proline dehydrogenase family protein [Solirubrobacteraceae bacterium]
MSRLRRRVLLALATSGAFERAVRALPGGEERAWRSARRYVAADPMATARRLHAAGLSASFDLFGEHGTAADAPSVAARYRALCTEAAAVPGAWLSLDLSHLAFDPGLLREVAAAVPPGRRVQVGAEEAAATDRVLGAVLGAHAVGLPVEATLQANLRRSPADADRLADAGVPVRLVKGAYVERDALPWGPATDAAYVALAHRLHAGGAGLALATHDAPLRDRLLGALPGARCELLLGVRPADATALAAAGRDVRVYVPFGEQWFRYFMRRRAESHGA